MEIKKKRKRKKHAQLLADLNVIREDMETVPDMFEEIKVRPGMDQPMAHKMAMKLSESLCKLYFLRKRAQSVLQSCHKALSKY